LKRKIIVIRLFLVSVLLGFTVSGFAIKAEGYILDINSDTIYGHIQLSRFDQVTGGLILNGIEEESLHSRVVFGAKNEKRFNAYFPEMLLGFGFKYQSKDYVFQRILVQRKSIIKSEKQQYRFMRLIYQENGGSRYKDVLAIPNPGLVSNKDGFLIYNSHLFRIKKNRTLKNESKDSLNSL
jgi:hypothetical protein